MWRAMGSLLTLRDQINALYPNRLRGADGLVGDAAHQATNSDHNPHDVDGVGRDIVSALDLTHDPAHGFDSYAFAETLRRNRDPRIKYVISNRRVFSSYPTGNRAAWAWGPYTGSDPHVNHVHISVNDNGPIALNRLSDTRTPWNLDSPEDDDMTPSQQYVQHVMNYRLDAMLHMRNPCVIPAFTATDGSRYPGITETNHLAAAVLAADDTGDPAGPPIDLGALANQIAADVVEQIDVPTAVENADAVLDAESARLAN